MLINGRVLRWNEKEIRQAKERRDAPQELLASKSMKKGSLISLIIGAVIGTALGVVAAVTTGGIAAPIIAGTITAFAVDLFPMMSYFGSRQSIANIYEDYPELKHMKKEDLLRESEIRNEAFLKWTENDYVNSYKKEIENVRKLVNAPAEEDEEGLVSHTTILPEEVETVKKPVEEVIVTKKPKVEKKEAKEDEDDLVL